MQHLPHCTFFFASHARMPTLLRRACFLWDLGTRRAGGSRMILVLPTRACPTFFALHVAWYIMSTGKASVLSTMTTMRSLNTTCASHSAFCRATVAGRRKEACCAPPPSRAYRQKWSPSRFRSAKKHVEQA
jgi:hypothetical protein